MAASLPSADQTLPFSQPVCQNCQTSTTPLWRRDEAGSVLCNACGLFLKLHGRPRPISLKTDVIKSRNRVKTTTALPKKKVRLTATGKIRVVYADSAQYEPNSTSAPITEVSAPNGFSLHRRVSQMATTTAPSERSHSPVSRTGTPGAQHDPNIAPQHVFDGASAAVADHTNSSPSLPGVHSFSHPSPGATALTADRSESMTYEQLVAVNTNLRTRVSELEVINGFYSDNENNLRRERDSAVRERDDLKRRVEELEKQLQERDDAAHPAKKPRLSQEPQE
ncbi:protein GZF3 [Exophiala spinifera]|uniref:Protein GZF3 n=1 Tax=Exophiala spinifera TaxID=91928 RepID=A0A0D2B5I0_9EURO|nr:protein GZF3 [Exophiala spinifera]KIW14173.1 protein GZF3 [Exophiala spinifera]